MHHPGIVFHRVKVYSLTADGGWDDTGTGLVSLEPLEVRRATRRRDARARALRVALPSFQERQPAPRPHEPPPVRRIGRMRAKTDLGFRKLFLPPSLFPKSAPSSSTHHPTQTHLDDDEAAAPLGLVVLGEENHRTLLVHRVSHEEIYHRQGERRCRSVGGGGGKRRPSPSPRPSLSPALKNAPPAK